MNAILGTEMSPENQSAPLGVGKRQKADPESRFLKKHLRALTESLSALRPGSASDWLKELAMLLQSTAKFSVTVAASAASASKRPKRKGKLDTEFVTICAPHIPSISPVSCFEILVAVWRCNEVTSGETSRSISRNRELENSFRALAKKATEALDEVLVNGRGAQLSDVLKFLESDFPDSFDQAIAAIRALPKAYLGRYPEDCRAIVQRFTTDSVQAAAVTFADPSQQVDVSQLAYALVKSWLAKDSSPASLAAFEVLRQYSETFQNVSLFGTPGECVSFNSTSFSGDGIRNGERVIVTVPGVQWIKDGRTRIIVSASVKKGG